MFRYVHTNIIAKDADNLLAFYKEILHCKSINAKRDLSAWLGNSMQHQAGKALYEQAEAVQNSNDEQLKDDWRKLQTSDNLYYLFTSTNEDGKVHDYFSPHPSPYDAFIYYMNTIRDINARLKHYGAN